MKRNVKIAVVCQYSSTCDWNCEKCSRLKELKIINLEELEGKEA